MKVLQILPSLHVGGVERGVIDLARAMKKRGEQTVVISSGGELVAELQKIGVSHYSFPVHKKSVFSLSLVAKIAEIIERERVDLVHARSRVPAWIGWLAARKAGVPFVTTCHGYYKAHPLSIVMGWGKRVIAISNVIARHMIDDFKISPEKVRLVHRGVDLSQFSWKPLHERRREPGAPVRIVNVGRLSPIKGQVEFLKAVHRVKRELQQPLEVLLVGSEGKGKTKYTERILETLKQLNLESCVRLLGTRRDIPEILAQSDLLVLSTLVPEAFGRVVVEAGAIGTPVIATRLGGLLDIIKSGQEGVLVEPGDIDGMARAMLGIVQNPEKSRAMTEKLRARVEEEFSLDQMTDKTLEVYREAIPEKKILVVKLGAAGDLILIIPSLRMLHERFPQAKITVLTDKRLAGILSGCPYIHDVIPVDRHELKGFRKLWLFSRGLRKEGFDVSVDFQNSKWTHLLSFLAGIPERFGFSRKPFGFLLNRAEHYEKAAESPVKNQFRILSKLGVRKLDESLELWPDETSRRRAEEFFSGFAGSERRKVGFVMGSSPRWETKRWPPEFFAQLADRLIRELDCRIVLLGSSDDKKALEKTGSFSGDAVLNLMGQTAMRDLVPLFKELDVLVTGDTAPLHVAAAVRARVVALFGPTDPRRHMPAVHHGVVLSRSLACQPCYSGVCKIEEKLACLKKISVDEVFQAVKRQLLASKPSVAAV